ncbi:MAG: helix-turn-helix transcriptional regulator [Oscillospiraceae bacterium]
MFANNLKRIRKEKGYTQALLGFQIGKTQQIISWYESGKVPPSIYVLEDIARVLDVSATDLISTEDNKHNKSYRVNSGI